MHPKRPMGAKDILSHKIVINGVISCIVFFISIRSLCHHMSVMGDIGGVGGLGGFVCDQGHRSTSGLSTYVRFRRIYPDI